MFSSPLNRNRRTEGTSTKEVSVPRRDTSSIEDPVEEFHYLLDRLGCLIEISKEAYEESLKGPSPEKASLGFFRRNRKNKDKAPSKDEKEKATSSKEEKDKAAAKEEKDSSKDQEGDKDAVDAGAGGEAAISATSSTTDNDNKKPAASLAASVKPALSVITGTPAKDTRDPSSPKSPPTPPITSPQSSTSHGDPSFIPIAEEEECIEIIRRVAELVVISERVVATQMDKDDKKRKEQKKQGWGSDITDADDEDINPTVEKVEAGSEAYMPIFDLFFERNGMGMLSDILLGNVFKLYADEPNTVPNLVTDNPNSGEGEGAQSREVEANRDNQPSSEPESVNDQRESATSEGATKDSSKRLLPSLKIATQAVQSVSILVQNVSRATSLYFVLSNNYVNALVDLPLDLYAAAELKKETLIGNASPMTRLKTYSTPDLAELTTHFVTFLKSLAMRMNTETLQFYLKYPTPIIDHELKQNADEEAKARALEFPLYARALDFCAAHHDSFVRVTAMNICLNTLRLTTVTPEGDEDAKMSGSSPDGVLHNANPLPFRERLAIATHTCAPSRVDRLATPIITKLSNIWCSLQEKFLDLDTHPEEELEKAKKGAPHLDPLKERERKHNSFRDAANTLQDQLLLLDDLLKVGLTALNEQIIEMMFATFVYPLLLQPLLVYYQRLATDADETPPLPDPFARQRDDRTTVDFRLVGRAPPHVTAPAKTALFTLAAVFHLISNRPFIRLLYTALFHPLSPAASGETVTSAEGSITTTDANGKKTIRLDTFEPDDRNERITYPFGGKEQTSSAVAQDDETCVFVLSPALAEVLKSTGGISPAKTRPNPYRRAILQCLEVPHHMSDFRKLSFNTVDAAFSFFDGQFLKETLLGAEFVDAKKGSDYDPARLREEVITALCEGLVNGKPGPFGTWKLQYDMVAAHALLAAIWMSPEAIQAAAQIVTKRFSKAALLLSKIPSLIPTTQHLGSIMNLVFYEAQSRRRKATFSDLFSLKDTPPESFSTAISSAATFRTLSNRSFEAPPSSVHLNKFSEHTAMDLGSSSCRAILKLEALSTFLLSISGDGKAQVEGTSPSGFALTLDRGIVSTKECYVEELARSIHSYLSPDFCNALTGVDNEIVVDRPVPGTTVALAGRSAMPCVCEAPPNSGISDNGAKMVVEGITWQSLYLAFFGPFLVLAEPAAGSPGSGRVVTCCPLSRITVARDPNPPADPNSPARRLLLAYKWFGFGTNSPSLFVYDETPRIEEYGPFNKVRLWRCKLDVWFEDEDSAAHAYHSIHFQIDKAKTLRGDKILDFLTHTDGFF